MKAIGYENVSKNPILLNNKLRAAKQNLESNNKHKATLNNRMNKRAQ
jgi:hypothetical protein